MEFTHRVASNLCYNRKIRIEKGQDNEYSTITVRCGHC